MNRQAEAQSSRALDVMDRSDRLDERIVVVSNSSHLMMVMALAFVVLLSVAQAVVLLWLATANRSVLVSNRAVLESQIPGLKAQIATRDVTISDQANELAQAGDAITKLAKQVAALGGNPGIITIRPPKHPPAR